MARQVDATAQLNSMFCSPRQTWNCEHIGIPQMLVCLYGEIPIHVDLNFMVPDQLISRPEDPKMLWDRNNMLHDALSNSRACPSTVDWQWIEDRFWFWIHYATTKVGRGELFAAIGFISFIREKVLGPIVLEMNGGKGDIHFTPPEGWRKPRPVLLKSCLVLTCPTSTACSTSR